MTVDGASTLSSFGAVVLMASLFGRQHLHLHRPDREDNEHDLNGQFWKRHRSLDNLLLSTSLSLPYHLRLPAGIHDPNIVFVNMTLPALVICLHQAAIFKADRNHLSSQISTESKRRCIIAADQIANLMKSVCHIDLATVSAKHFPWRFGSTDRVQMNPFLAFCLYIASRVFVQYLKSQKDDSTVVSSLQFLLSAMDALKTGAPLSGSFLAQLEVELEGSDFTLSQSSRFPRPPNSKSANVPADHECATVFELGKARDRGQATAAKANTPAVSKAAGGNSLDFSQPQSISLEPYMGRFADPCTDSSRPPAPDPVFNPTTPAYEENSYFMDMDMPFENTNSPNVPSQQNSGHPTPSTSSNNASSQTSFTPPHQEDYPNLAKTSSGTEVVANTASQAAFFAQQQRFTTLDSNFSTFMKGPFPEGPSNPLGMSAAWSQSENGQRLGNAAGEFILNGITAEDIASWQPENMVAGNDWEFPGWASDNTTS